MIMPAYNAARYLGCAVDSVLRQRLSDLELLIVDDGSSDGTLDLAHRYRASDPRVRVLQQQNAGPGPARNLAFGAASAPLFAFLDSDDEWHPDFLAEQVAVLRRRPDIDVVIGNAWNRGGHRDGLPSRPIRGADQTITLCEMLADETALFIMAVFRRQAVERVGGFDPSLLTNEEYDMWIRAALEGVRFTRNPRPLGWYTCRQASLSSDDERMIGGILRVFARTRPRLVPGSPEQTILDRTVRRLEGDLSAAGAKARFAKGEDAAGATAMAALYRRRGGATLAAASTIAAFAPTAIGTAFRLREWMRGRHSDARRRRA